MSHSATAMELLGKATHQEHLRLETQPFFTALPAGDLPIVSYVGLLRALSVVYEAVEQAMERARDPWLVSVWDTSLSRLPLIDHDLAYFQRYGLPQTAVAVLRASLLAQNIGERAHTDPVSLLGYLYVLQDLAHHGSIAREHIARDFGLGGTDGLAYLSSTEQATNAHENTFTQRMNAVQVDAAALERIRVAAVEALTGVGHILAALYPFDASPPHDLARELNPAAGSHAVTTDARELQAALRAGERTWHAFPYYQWRYGDRGTQFTRSDSAWLVTLAAHSQQVIDQQIGWLGRVLAARGMPRWMLELHLDVLYEELMIAHPGQRLSYARLHQAARSLHEQRQGVMSDHVLAAHLAAFDEHVGSEWSTRLPRTGGLLAAAVADETLGITHAVTSIEGWMTDASRFPPHWIEAVRTTIREARTHTKVTESEA